MQFSFVTKKRYDVIAMCFSLQIMRFLIKKEAKPPCYTTSILYLLWFSSFIHSGWLWQSLICTAIRFYSNKNYYSDKMKERCESPGKARGRQSSGEKWRKECLRLLSRHFSHRDKLTRNLWEWTYTRLTLVKSVCETAPKSLFGVSTCVPGFEYAPWLAC